ncbi:hypothetical protein BDP67DRAFT_504185 [Colletotrichum lupini]|nr:hypothetical protein BDP67DRAFT_504185 [Colletotrichum lupini]
MIPQQRQTRPTPSCLEALTLSLEEPDTQAELGLEARPRTRAGWPSALATPNPSKPDRLRPHKQARLASRCNLRCPYRP